MHAKVADLQRLQEWLSSLITMPVGQPHCTLVPSPSLLGTMKQKIAQPPLLFAHPLGGTVWINSKQDIRFVYIATNITAHANVTLVHVLYTCTCMYRILHVYLDALTAH